MKTRVSLNVLSSNIKNKTQENLDFPIVMKLTNKGIGHPTDGITFK